MGAALGSFSPVVEAFDTCFRAVEAKGKLPPYWGELKNPHSPMRRSCTAGRMTGSHRSGRRSHHAVIPEAQA